MEWLELSAEVGAEAVDAVAEVFARWGQGVAIEPPIVSTLDPEKCTVDPTRPSVVRTYLPMDDTAPARRKYIEDALWHLHHLGPVTPLEVRILHEDDWANAWKDHFHVQHIGRRLVVVPSWRTYDPRHDEVVIHLDPGMAFGSGIHPSTRLCLMALERYVADGCHVADVGTGSGILAIAAAKLGAASVVAVDVDATAVRVARENVALNVAERRVEVRQGGPEEAQAGGPDDLVVANLTATIIAALAADIAALLTPDGRLIASGIVEEREDVALAALDRVGLNRVARRTEGDWLMIEAMPASGAL